MRGQSDATNKALEHMDAQRRNASCAPGAPADAQPANSAALQQILQRAQAIFPEHSIAPDDAVAVSARPAPGGAPHRTLADWDEEVNALLRDDDAAPVWQGDMDCASPCEDPFPGQFPGSAWVRVERPGGQGHYFAGRMRRGNEFFRITAIPGEYRALPPGRMQSVGRYIPCAGGGCWVRIEKD